MQTQYSWLPIAAAFFMMSACGAPEPPNDSENVVYEGPSLPQRDLEPSSSQKVKSFEEFFSENPGVVVVDGREAENDVADGPSLPQTDPEPSSLRTKRTFSKENAGSLNSYNSSSTPVVSYSAAPEPTLQDPAPAVVESSVTQDGFYDESKGSNADFGYTQSHACGGALDGATCLVILNDHMRRVRLERDAGTILVGNPTIADVTVLGKDTIFVSARSVGSTNIIALDENDEEIRTFEVFVREPKTKRVVQRNTSLPEHYQCAPDCLRALTQPEWE